MSTREKQRRREEAYGQLCMGQTGQYVSEVALPTSSCMNSPSLSHCIAWKLRSHGRYKGVPPLRSAFMPGSCRGNSHGLASVCQKDTGDVARVAPHLSFQRCTVLSLSSPRFRFFW